MHTTQWETGFQQGRDAFPRFHAAVGQKRTKSKTYYFLAQWSMDSKQALAFVAQMCKMLELAGSPLPTVTLVEDNGDVDLTFREHGVFATLSADQSSLRIRRVPKNVSDPKDIAITDNPCSNSRQCAELLASALTL
jgi:hypothetical protein